MARLGLGAGWALRLRQRLRPGQGGHLSRQLRRCGDHFARGRRLGAVRRRPAGPRRPRLGVQPLPGLQPGRRAGGPGGRPLVGLLRLLAADRGAGRRGPRAARDRDRERRRPAHLARRARISPRSGEALAGAGLPLRRAGDRRGGLPAAVAAAGVRHRHARAAAGRPGRAERRSTPARCAGRRGRPAAALAARWIWWRAAAAAGAATPTSPPCWSPTTAVAWHTPAQTAALLELMAPLHRAAARGRAGARRAARWARVYRRMRVEDGQRVQRAEVRFDGLAGCLRTPARRLLAPGDRGGRGRARCARAC